MPLLKTCGYPRCPTLIKTGRFCDRHQKKVIAHKEAREHVRREKEPWRFLYELPEWKSAKRIVRARDDHQCTHVENGERCPLYSSRTVRQMLHVHHLIPLATIWARFGDDVAMFTQFATNPDYLTTLCPDHHHAADQALRRDQTRFWQESFDGKFVAKPKPKRSSRKRR